jgi:glycosyltransferase involved in cell wall biosynthesis
MNILFVTQYYYPDLDAGGPVVKISALAEHLMRRGHFVSILTASGAGSAGEQNRPSFGSVPGPGGPRVVSLWTALRYRLTTINPTIHRAAGREVRYADAVHLFGFYDLLGPVVAWEARRRGVPYVIEPMGMFVPILRSLGKKRIYHRLLGRAMVDGAARVVATSALERSELIRSGVPPEKVFERRNGIDMPDFSILPPRGSLRRRLGIADSEKVVLYLGRLTPKKNPELLLRAFARQQDADLRLVVAGPAEPGYRQSLARLAGELGLGARVTFTGPLFGREKLSAFVDADLFVLPSMNENFGNAVAESVAMGTPVVITDRCGIAPFVRDRAGLVVPPEEPAVSDAINRLLMDERLYKACKEACPSVARQLSWDEPVAEMEALYARMAGNALGPSPARPRDGGKKARRILLVTQYYMPSWKFGGPVSAIKGLAENLAARGHRVTVLTACEKLAARGRRVMMSGVEIIYLRSIARYRAITVNPEAWSYCRDWISSFDAVHIFGVYDVLGPVAAYHAARAGRPYVVETLGMAVPLVRGFYRKRTYNYLVGERVLEGAERIVVTSAIELEQIAAHAPVLKEKLFLRRNGIDLAEFRVRADGSAAWRALGLEGGRKVLFVGRLAPIKNVDGLIRALSRMEDPSVCVAVVGPDEGDGYGARLRRLSKELGLADRVLFTGPIYGAERAALMAGADVLVLPSLYESFGNAAAEAVAAGTPVVVTRNCGIAPYVEGRAGLVSEESDEGLARNLGEILADQEMYRRFKEMCSVVAREFTWDEPVSQMEEIYEELSRAASPPGAESGPVGGETLGEGPADGVALTQRSA